MPRRALIITCALIESHFVRRLFVLVIITITITLAGVSGVCLYASIHLSIYLSIYLIRWRHYLFLIIIVIIMIIIQVQLEGQLAHSQGTQTDGQTDRQTDRQIALSDIRKTLFHVSHPLSRHLKRIYLLGGRYSFIHTSTHLHPYLHILRHLAKRGMPLDILSCP